MIERVDLRALSQPVGILHLLQVPLTCITFGLVASVGSSTSSYWAWCMFCWCFCFVATFLIIVLEFSRVNEHVPFSWDDLTAAIAAIASLMLLSASVIYPATLFSCPNCDRQAVATTLSWLGMAAYVGELVLAFLRRTGQTGGFLFTLPGLLKILEVFVACIIFTALDPTRYVVFPALQWCVAAYALCFVFAFIIVALTVARLGAVFSHFDKLVCIYNLLGAAIYMSAAVLWPLYAFKGHPRPANCTVVASQGAGSCLAWDSLVVITFMSIVNLLVYLADAGYSIYLVFIVQRRP